MTEQIAHLMVTGGALYALIGILFGLAFVSWGVPHLDPAAQGTSWRFRAIILPGAAAFWPLLLYRWRAGRGPQDERTAHDRAAGEVSGG